MSTDWLGPRIYRPSLEEVLRGALSASAPQVHYITHFRYPSDGGFCLYLNKFVPHGQHQAQPRAGLHRSPCARAPLLQRSRDQLRSLVSSVPLPDLIRMIQGAPQDVVDAARRLACSTCVLVNIGVNREDLSNAHMTYFYDRGHLLHAPRLPAHALREQRPSGRGQHSGGSLFLGEIQAFHRQCRGLDRARHSRPAPLRSPPRRRPDPRQEGDAAASTPTSSSISNAPKPSRRSTAYLDDIGIAYCGRYGDWGYMWTDESFKSGEKAAERALSAVVSST